MDIPVPLTPREIDLLEQVVVKARWTDPWEGDAEAEWLEDVLETLGGDEVGFTGNADLSRILRKLVIAATEARHA